ncbi:hypothetical protein GOBAR_AA05347 [Gossypium barbadense]|uniref:Uncharacterized protein n=1 Tax=Gossypium barbadense TaxID=3634 RepID=A0A2P5YI43_GOSBA|nr:hypothetical protein GOBAR_AA05347 [Gossypium barbadense]
MFEFATDLVRFPIKWSSLSRDICSFQQTLPSERAVAQFWRLRTECPLVLKDLIIARNVFRYCLKGFSPNERRPGDNNEMKLHMFALVESSQGEGSRQNVNMLTIPTDHRVVANVGTNQNSGDNLSEIDSISRELNKVMHIDSLISGAHKKHKTITRAMCIASTNVNSKFSKFSNGELPTCSPFSLPVAIDEDTPSLVPRVSPSVLVVGEAPIRNKRLSSARMPSTTSLSSSLQFLHSEANIVGLKYEEVHQRELVETKVASGPFNVRKVDLDALDGMDISNLGFDVLFPSSATWDSFVSTWKNSPNLYLEDNPTEGEDVVPPAKSDDATPLDNIDQVGSFALANYVRGYGFYPTSLSMTTRSFAHVNCVRGCGFYLASLSVTVRSFTLTNCVKGCGFYPASLSMIAGRFALANYVGGWDFYPASLCMIARSFAVANCVTGCSFYPASLNITWELCYH